MASIFIPFLILGGIGILAGLLLGFASKKFAQEEDPRQQLLRECLPGANCGGCGFAGCDAYARAVAAGEVPVGRCGVGGKETADKMAAIMGVSSDAGQPMVAFTACCGNKDKAERRFHYYGTSACREASVIPGGSIKSCRYGCLGFGDCVKACLFDAIHIKNGIAVVDRDKCRGCRACIEACPKHLIRMISKEAAVEVYCSNCERGLDVKDICKAGCIGCGICSRQCPQKAITMQNDLPVIDHALCDGCGLCAEKCPVHVLRLIKEEGSSLKDERVQMVPDVVK